MDDINILPKKKGELKVIETIRILNHDMRMELGIDIWETVLMKKVN